MWYKSSYPRRKLRDLPSPTYDLYVDWGGIFRQPFTSRGKYGVLHMNYVDNAIIVWIILSENLSSSNLLPLEMQKSGFSYVFSFCAPLSIMSAQSRRF
jgi:hypothetical protein